MCKYKKLIESEKGITLIALVVTIIVLLILAGISMVILTGKSGVLNQSSKAKEETQIAKYKEELDIHRPGIDVEKVISGLSSKEYMDRYEEELRKDTMFAESEIIRKDEETIVVVTKEKYVFTVSIDKEAEYEGIETPPPDLEEGDIQFIVTPSTPTNKAVKVTLTTEITGYKLQYSIDEGNTWNDYAGEITVNDNSKIYARLWNDIHAGGYATGNIENIDRLQPKDFELQIGEVTTNTILVSGETEDAEKTEIDACSGIKGYMFSKDNGVTWEPEIPQENGSYVFSGLSSFTEYNIKMKAIDNAGNEKETEVVIQKTEDDKLQEPTMKFKSKTTNSITIDTVVEDEAGRNITYTLYVSENEAGPYEAKANKEAVAGTNVTLTASNLDMYTNYYYYVGVKSGTVTAESSTKNQVRTFCSGRTNSCTPTYCKGGTRTSYQGTCSKCSGAGSITCTGTIKKVYTTGGPGSTCPSCGDPNSYGGYNWSCDTCSASGHYYWCTCGYKNGSTPSHNKKKCTTCGGDGKVTKYVTSNCTHGFGYGSSHYWCQHSNDMGSSATHYYCEHSTAGVEHD